MYMWKDWNLRFVALTKETKPLTLWAMEWSFWGCHLWSVWCGWRSLMWREQWPYHIGGSKTTTDDNIFGLLQSKSSLVPRARCPMPRSRILGSYTASSNWISHQNYFVHCPSIFDGLTLGGFWQIWMLNCHDWSSDLQGQMVIYNGLYSF